jgi:HPt (histidine-containing phosphotransfer) domain-containing protein
MNKIIEEPIICQLVVENLRSLQRPGRPDFYLELVNLFLETTAESADQIVSSIQNLNLQSISDAAHSLKSSAANIGALRLSKTCFELEKYQDSEPKVNLTELGDKFKIEYAMVVAQLHQVIENAA